MLEKVLKYFKELSKVPRCSGSEQKVCDFVVLWAKKKGFKYKIDKIWNVVVYVPSTEWLENKETIILQWHLDMVCWKKEGISHDFEKDSIEVIEKDWFLRANKTTLWADNGIWLAIAMVMADIEVHPKLEILATISEEVWMIWAMNLDSGMLSGKKLINLDTENSWEIIIASALWIRHNITSEFELHNWIYDKYIINITWLKWWHSWIEIDKSKWNWVDCLMEFLNGIWWNIEFYFINSWTADNVIPNELESVVWVEYNKVLLNSLDEFIEFYRREYWEDDFEMSIEKSNFNWKAIWKNDSKKIIDAILKSRSWVYKYSDTIEWFVQTSQNLWILKLNKWKLNIEYLIRSSVDEELFELAEKTKCNFWEFAKVSSWVPFPGWVEDSNSSLLKNIKTIYEKINSKEVKVLWIHAWLECWTIKSKMPIWSEIISIWPNIFWAHTPEERCEIKSIVVICRVLEEFLRKI